MTGAPLLCGPFGELVTIEAEPFVTSPAKGPREQMLRVLRIGERTVAEDLCIRWTYGGWRAEVPEETGLDGFVIEPSHRYRLRGYETGSWVGIPRAALHVRVDDFGPPQGLVFGFRNWFRVLDGERVESPAGTATVAPR